MHNLNEVLFFTIFLLFITAILVIDLGLFNKRSHIISLKESLTWTVIWVGFALGFYILIISKGSLIHGITDLDQLKQIIQNYKHPINIDGMAFTEAIKLYEHNLGLEYLTGYIIEYALSIDNVFVMIVIFMAFGVKKVYYHRILFWGIWCHCHAIYFHFFSFGTYSGIFLDIICVRSTVDLYRGKDVLYPKPQ